MMANYDFDVICVGCGHGCDLAVRLLHLCLPDNHLRTADNAGNVLVNQKDLIF